MLNSSQENDHIAYLSKYLFAIMVYAFLVFVPRFGAIRSAIRAGRRTDILPPRT